MAKSNKVAKVAQPAPVAEGKVTVSSRIRELAGQQKTRSEIVKILSAELGRPIKYQHVRNVLVTQLKKNDTKSAKA